MNTPPTIKQALQKLTESIKPILTPTGGTQLVTTETTPTIPTAQPSQTTPK